MKKFFTLWILMAPFTILPAQAPLTFHDYSAVTITGDTISLSKYYGTKIMVVNTASYCEYTPEFAQLEQLYEQYHQYHFLILGFPCNDFNSQDPNSDSAIYAFCTDNYQVSFQMMSKVAIIAGDTAPVYKWLQQKSLNGVESDGVSWNFNKFLIDESGHWIRHFDSPTSPLDTAITNWIKSPSSIPPQPIPTFEETLILPPASSFLPPIVEKRLKTYSLPGNPPPITYDKQVATGVNTVSSSDEFIRVISANPNGSVIDLAISSLQPVTVGLYSLEGRLVATLFNGHPEEEQRVSFPVSALPSGVYLIRAQSAEQQKTIKYLIER